MDAHKIIDNFINVVREQDFIFDDVVINNIPTLQKNLTSIEPKTVESVCEVIKNWFRSHESVRDAVLNEEREIGKVKKYSQANQENILENYCRILDEELKKLYDSKKNQGQEQKRVN